MDEYKIGALSSLISGDSLPNSNLFTTSKKQLEAPKKIEISSLAKKKPQQINNEDEKISSETVEESGKLLNSPKKNNSKKKKKKKEGGADKDINLEALKAEGVFTEPSLKYKVKMEDSKKRIVDEEADKKTIFIGNLPIKTVGHKKGLIKLFSKFGKVVSLRFRGASKPDLKTTKRTAVIKKDFNENRSNILAYIKYSEELSVDKAVDEMNGYEFEGNVLRVDHVVSSSNDSKTNNAKDQKKAVFVGNLDLKITEDQVRKHFQDAGKIEDVRLIRDKSSGMGKGFGYVNFYSVDSVEVALRLNDSELNGRNIRVMRSVKKPKKLIPMKVKETSSKKFSSSSGISTKKVFKKEQKNTFMGVKTDEKKKKHKKSKGDLKKKIVAKKLMR